MSTEEKWDNTKPVVTALEAFLEKVKDMYKVYREKNHPNLPADTFEYKVNSKYIRVVHRSGTHGSVFCFIDTTNGNVLFPSGWAKPDLKNPRGNLFSEQGGLEAITQTHGGSTNYHPHIRYIK